ncbi:hypothetical protein BCO_0900074 (plasmid) [Borrelia coriaceae ATCC 43381]|uniref:Uncharacterized protein n=1 Tax=Borrelia coriaceae ATCC 43381 TaxID=1408429 RepID=W5SX76_9SPIR|nr:hypothetical protein BCO_0900074 [Borrelia coriaceae ATCC 43381]
MFKRNLTSEITAIKTNLGNKINTVGNEILSR